MGHFEAPAKVLVVDDHDDIRLLLRELLESRGYSVETAGDASEARSCLSERPFELALCDLNMPGESGLSLARHIAAAHPDTVTVVVTALDDPATADDALSCGAQAYVIKPFRSTELLATVASALRRRRQDLQAHRSELETMQRLARTVVHRSSETADHIERVGACAGAIAEDMGERDLCEPIRLASLLHDIGKVAIADAVLLKPGPLDRSERDRMKRHTVIGHELLMGYEGELMRLAAEIALNHHERFDGDGYPDGLAGDAIPLSGRIVAVADVFDALTHDRVYREAMPVEDALAVMARGRGRQFDPDALDAFLETRARQPVQAVA